VADSTAKGAQATGNVESLIAAIPKALAAAGAPVVVEYAFSKRAADRGVGHHGRVRADRYPGERRRNSASGGLR
jgi:hypothetical protein